MQFAKRYDQSKPAGNKIFLEGLRIDNEPVSRLGRYFIQAAAIAEELDITLTIAKVQELVEINRRNQDGWRPVLPLFDPILNDLDDSNSFALIARNSRGDAVATGACRLYDWTGSNYVRELESLRIFSKNPLAAELPYVQCSVSAKRARGTRGRAVFAGAAWCHPSVRGQALSALIPRTSKALALASWDFDHMVGLMLEDVLARGFAKRFGYSAPEVGAVLTEKSGKEKRYALLSMSRSAAIRHVEDYLASSGSQVDSVVGQRLS